MGVILFFTWDVFVFIPRTMDVVELTRTCVFMCLPPYESRLACFGLFDKYAVYFRELSEFN